MSDRAGPDPTLVQAAVQDVSRCYIAQRRERVHPFCSRYFSVSGAWQINRNALGHDLWKVPANILWAAPYLLSRGTATVFRRLGWQRASALLGSLPPGFATAVAREVEWLLYTELLELPVAQEGRTSGRDALLESIAGHEVIAGFVLGDLLELQQLANMPDARRRLEDFFAAYTTSRSAAADLTGSLLSLAAGAGVFKQLTPGALALGQAAAGALAQQLAISSFALGPTLGSFYYTLFPAAASSGLVVATVSGLMLAMGILTALTGVVTDPLQQALGLHERRLQRLLDVLENDLLGAGGTFQLRDAYVARVFDLIDVVKAAVQALKS